MEDYSEEEIEEKPSLFKKISVIIIAIFLLILMLSYFTLFGVRDILEGIVGSHTINDDKIYFSDKIIYFENNTYNRLLGIYDKNLENEFKACLVGKYDKNYFIYDLYVPKTYEQQPSEVISEPCDSIISLHSHPRMFCIPSQQDFKAFKQEKSDLMLVMCEKDRFTIYKK
jgi:proteasome lid subunit RPN8/RPN11